MEQERTGSLLRISNKRGFETVVGTQEINGNYKKVKKTQGQGKGLPDFHILKEALLEGGKNKGGSQSQPHGFPQMSPYFSSSNNAFPIMSPPSGGLSLQPLNLNSTFSDPSTYEGLRRFDTESLRREVIKKYTKRLVTPRPLSIWNESDVLEAFADFVINVPMLVDGHHISRKAWAKAFYESDMIASAKCLFEALFTKDEMRDCTLNGKNQTQELSAVKMLAILRASCWMKEKNQDPYFFNPEIQSHNIHPTKEEQDKIEKKVFTERRSQANRKNKKRHHGQGPDSDSPSPDSISEASSPGASSEHSPALQIFEFGEIEELFYRFPEEFLSMLIPNWSGDYVFIDGLLVDKTKWSNAFKDAADPVKSAWLLFRALFSDEEITKCTLNGKNGTTELCPVKKLAIIRAVEWMRRTHDCPSDPKDVMSTYFDNDDPKCNVFPSKEDKDKIENKVFTEKRYQESRHIHQQQKEK